MKSAIQKWMFRSALCTLCVAGTAAAQAQTNEAPTNSEQGTNGSQVYLQQLTSHPAKFRLHVTSAVPGSPLLKITDMDGNTLLSKKMQQASFAQTFDLSALKDGVYTFTLLKGDEVVKKVVQLNTDYVMVKKVSIR